MEKNKLQHHDITTDKLIDDIRNIIEQGRKQAYSTVNKIAVLTYWHIGRRIVEEEQHGEARAQYGTRLIKLIADRLSIEFGTNYSDRRLRDYRQFYLNFNDLPIWHSRVPNLTWTHFRRIMAVPHPDARRWYAEEASREMWSIRTLDRNISTQYYGRLCAAKRDGEALPVIENLNGNDPKEYIKSPVVAEFLNFKRDTKYSESDLEQALIDNLKKFIMELGRGFAFVERQKHIVTETDDFFIDLVFYNFKMKRFVLFELKTHKVTHADVGQLDMYVRMFDDLMKEPSDNPTIGVLLCTETDTTIAKYSVLHNSEQLFATQYMAYMPTEEELSRVIEQQKRFFLEQHGKEE
ncbi:MAG: PDDEXK nuclease domain-containing protein [Bacteroidales bacterium]|nr:PDDEXK nuclease domain-containing protein [Bacteroidales bacterium]